MFPPKGPQTFLSKGFKDHCLKKARQRLHSLRPGDVASAERLAADVVQTLEETKATGDKLLKVSDGWARGRQGERSLGRGERERWSQARQSDEIFCHEKDQERNSARRVMGLPGGGNGIHVLGYECDVFF